MLKILEYLAKNRVIFGLDVKVEGKHQYVVSIYINDEDIQIAVVFSKEGKFLAYDYENIIKEEGGSTNNEKKIIKWLRTQETDKFLMEESKKVLLKKGIYTLLPKKSK